MESGDTSVFAAPVGAALDWVRKAYRGPNDAWGDMGEAIFETSPEVCLLRLAVEIERANPGPIGIWAADAVVREGFALMMTRLDAFPSISRLPAIAACPMQRRAEATITEERLADIRGRAAALLATIAKVRKDWEASLS